MMKKSKIAALILVMGVLAVGCGKKNDLTSESADSTAQASTSPAVSEEENELRAKILAEDLTSYVTLGEYKGVKYTETKKEITDKEVEAKIQSTLESKAETKEITDRDTVKKGDIANIDFVGKKDGKEFDGGSSKAYDLTIGSGQFIDGFEDGLIGKKVGETVKLNLTFPESYSNSDLAGQDVVFEVTINSISEKIVPELTDEFVAKVSSTSKTVAEYKKEVKKSLEEEAQAELEDNRISGVWKIVCDNAKVSEYPDSQMDYYVDLIKDNQEAYLAQLGYTVKDYMESYGLTEDDYNAQVKEVAEQSIKEKMVCQKVAQTEKITVSDKDYKEELQNWLDSYQLEDEKALTDLYGSSAVAQVKEYKLLSKVQDFLLENAKITTK